MPRLEIPLQYRTLASTDGGVSDPWSSILERNTNMFLQTPEPA
jgi:hypothetical protein